MSEKYQLLVALQLLSAMIALGMYFKYQDKPYQRSWLSWLVFGLGWTGFEIWLAATGTHELTWQIFLFILINAWLVAKSGMMIANGDVTDFSEVPFPAYLFSMFVIVGGLLLLIVTGYR